MKKNMIRHPIASFFPLPTVATVVKNVQCVVRGVWFRYVQCFV